ncbi:hypothetical protein ACFV1L_22055 [Kitasatospora sp. NPDC059646]|uniref:hypothetical protein n=1 Tax=Kitasatospora sp. NPDC059646 TaxID=3346893 RepID=UPI00369EF4DC
MSDPRPYPTTVEEILAALAAAPGTPAAPTAALVVPQPDGTPAVITSVGSPYGHQPAPYIVALPQAPGVVQQPAPAQGSAWTDAPLWLRASILSGSIGLGTAGVGVGIGQAAPGLEAAARFLLALAAVFGVGVLAWLLIPRQGRQQQAPGVVQHITTHVTANVSANASGVGRQRNRY